VPRGSQAPATATPKAPAAQKPQAATVTTALPPASDGEDKPEAASGAQILSLDQFRKK
jgi:hypothetical protein